MDRDRSYFRFTFISSIALLLWVNCLPPGDAGNPADKPVLKSLSVSMRSSWSGQETRMRYHYLAPDSFRMDVILDDGTISGVSAAGDHWNSENGEIGELDEEGLNQLLQGFADLTGDAEAIRAYYGARVESCGEGGLDGVPCDCFRISGMHKLDPDISNLVSGTLWVSRASGLPLRLEFDYTAMDGTRQVIEYGVVEGCAVAETMTLFAGAEQRMVISVEERKVNGPIDPTLFKRP